tara:strand:- start:1426 stop:1737 length:312 start_codon:yes stop_codon:yes gene_type:complete
MTNTEYEEVCKLTKNLDNLDPQELKAYLAIGLAGEVGELLNILKKKMYYSNYHVDYANLKDEMGDCLYYLTNLVTDCGWTLDEIKQVNQEKVKNVLARRATAE